MSATAQRNEHAPTVCNIPIIPASMFGMVLGVAGLSNTWRAARQIWNISALVSDLLMAAAAIIWAILIILFALKWAFARAEALNEARHPIQCCFIALAGVATMLVALGALPHSRTAAILLFAIGVLFTFGFALWRTGMLWQGGRAPETTTPALYLPIGAGGFVSATVIAALGYADWGQLAFGCAFFTWLAIESVLLHRLYAAPETPPALRPVLGIQLAPPAVGAVAYLAVNGGHPDIIVHAMIGYGLLQALILLRLLPWIMAQPFTASYWTFTFGATALANTPLRLMAHGETGAIATIAPALFVGANITVGIVALGTLRLIAQGRLLPSNAPAPSPVAR